MKTTDIEAGWSEIVLDTPEDARWRQAINALRERYAGTSHARDVNALLDELIVLKIFRDRGM